MNPILIKLLVRKGFTLTAGVLAGIYVAFNHPEVIPDDIKTVLGQGTHIGAAILALVTSVLMSAKNEDLDITNWLKKLNPVKKRVKKHEQKA